MRIAFLALYNHYAYGARCLAAYLERAGHETLLLKVKHFLTHSLARTDDAGREAILASGHMPVFETHPFDYVVCPYPTPLTAIERELLLGELERFGADIVGFSLTSSHLPLAIELSQLIRARFPKMRQIWGGIHPTMDPEGCLEHADAVCVGEGEEALLEYAQDPRRTDIANLWTRDPGGAIVRNPMRPLIQDLDSLPIPMFGGNEVLIEHDRAWPMDEISPEEASSQLVISSTRGCPFSCTYCLHGVLHDMYPGQKYLRRKSVDGFLDEIQSHVGRYHLTRLSFWDDVFMMGPEWIEEFSDKYPKRIGLPFGGNGHPSTTSPEILRNLKKAGAYFATIGLQSGSPYISGDIYGRRVSTEKVLEFGRNLDEAGLDELVYDLLTRCPYEREEDLRATVKLLARMPKPSRVTIKHLVLFPFTKITRCTQPKGNVSEKTYLFYEMLYLLAEQPGFDPALLDSLVDDPNLREHPEKIERLVQHMARAEQENQELRQRIQAAEQDNQALRERIHALEGDMPWGIKRATTHLAGQVKNRLQR